MVPPAAAVLALSLALAGGPAAAQTAQPQLMPEVPADPAPAGTFDAADEDAAPAEAAGPVITPFQTFAAPAVIPAVVNRDPFEARAVQVDATAANVSAARDRALVQGRVAALRQVLERIATREDVARMTLPDAAQVIDMVRDFSIANERSSAVRYLAELTVRFHPDAVRDLLRARQIAFTETMSKPLLIAPVIQMDAYAPPNLWDDPNPWRDAWNRLPPRDSLVPLMHPMGDIHDLSLLTADQAVARDALALDALAARYQAGGVVVATATLGVSAEAETVQITLSEVRPNLPVEETVLTFTGNYGQPREDMLLAAVTDAAAAIEDSWKRRNRLQYGLTGQLTALVPVTELKDWLAVKKKLSEVTLVERVDVQAMTRDRVQVTLFHVGDQSQLELAMAQHDLRLSWQGSVWSIESAQRAAVR